MRHSTLKSTETLALVACVIMALSCDSKTPAGPAAAPPAAAAATPGPATPPAAMRTVEVTEAKAAEGGKLFAERCVACHAENGDGRIGIGPRLNSASFLAAASDAMLRRTITFGRVGTTMIPWGSAMTAAQIDAVIAHLRSWQKVEPATLNEAPLSGKAAEGEKVYIDICVHCHGQTGAGYQETANGTGIGRKAFLDSATNGFLRHVIKQGKSQTKMRPFDKGSRVAVANLSDQEIEDVIAYLRSRAW